MVLSKLGDFLSPTKQFPVLRKASQGRQVRVRHDAYKHHGQNRGKAKKCKLNTQKVNSAEMGNMYKFGGKGGNFLILWKYGEYAICIFGLGGMDAPEESCPLEQENKEVGEIDHHRTWHWD